jgi:putative molybdopterin biosynthesis protein
MARIEASRVKTLRLARGLSQRDLSRCAGITRQAVGAIENGNMQPSVGIGLGLAHALGTTVEELFGDEPTAALPARAASATIAGRTVTHPLGADYLAIEPSESLVPNVFLAGCELAVGLLARHAMARSRDVRVLWLEMTNGAALDALVGGTAHAAVVHGELTPQQTRRIQSFARFELATTEEGWLFAAGNPLGLRGAADLARKRARLANRPAGSGARRLLDQTLREANLDPQRVAGYDRELRGQLDAGRAIAQGFADAAIGTASSARLFTLDFIPLREERCTLFVPSDSAQTPEVRAVLDALRSNGYRRDLEALGVYDARRTGEHLG